MASRLGPACPRAIGCEGAGGLVCFRSPGRKTSRVRGRSRSLGTVQATVRPGETADIAFIIFPDLWNCKYGRTATRAMINNIFAQYELEKISANIDTRNLRSIRMVQSLGLAHVRTIKDADYFKGQSSDEYEYEVTRDSWLASRSK